MNKKTTFVPKERRFFLNNMNSWLSNFIIEEFRTDHLPDAKVKNIFMGTTNTSYQPLPRYFHPHVTSIQTDYNYSQEVFTNEIFIFNLDDANLDEVDFVINGLKTLKYDTEKTLVLISNILTWGKTPQKVKTEVEIANMDATEEEYVEPSCAGDDKGNNEQNEGDDIEDNNNNNGGEHEEKEDDDNNNNNNNKNEDKRLSLSNHLDNSQITNSKNVSHVNEDTTTNNANTNVNEVLQHQQHKERVFYYKEHEYMQRVPHKHYFRYKFIETKALAAAAASQYLRVYIICPGFIYGCGESFFYDYFKLAWLNKPTPITIVGDGKNCIPTIHVLDLMQILRKVIDKKPPTKYILAVDKTKNATLKSIITSIVKSMGESKVQLVDDYNIDEIDVPNCLELEVDIKVRTTKYMLDERKPDEDIEDYEKRKFKWHCEYGIPDNMEKLRNEFNMYRGLKSVKMCVVGPPSSGKTKICKHIAEKLQIPYLTVDNVIQWGKTLQNEFGDEIRMKEQEIEEAVQKAIEDYDKRKNKKKSDPPLDVHALRKFPSDFLSKIVYQRLQSSDCVGKGYILDNYPKKHQDCVDLFMKDDNVVLHDILPESVVVISDYTEESLMNNVKSVPSYEDNAVELDARFNRRLNEYKANNEGEGVETVEMFFSKHNIECYHVNQVNSVENYDEEFNGMYAYLERNGPINNYERLCDDDENREIVKHHLSDNVMRDNEEIQEEKGESVDDDEDDADEQQQHDEQQQQGDTRSNVNKTTNTKKDEDKKDNTNVSGDNSQQQQQQSDVNNNSNQHNVSDVELHNNQRKIDELLLRERKLLEKKSEVLRRYLSENVIPLLAKGVLNICQNMPDDPVEALANYLLDNSFNKNDNNIENINKDINQSSNNNNIINNNKNTSIDQSHNTSTNKHKVSSDNNNNNNKQLLDLYKSEDQSD